MLACACACGAGAPQGGAAALSQQGGGAADTGPVQSRAATAAALGIVLGKAAGPPSTHVRPRKQRASTGEAKAAGEGSAGKGSRPGKRAAVQCGNAHRLAAPGRQEGYTPGGARDATTACLAAGQPRT